MAKTTKRQMKKSKKMCGMSTIAVVGMIIALVILIGYLMIAKDKESYFEAVAPSGTSMYCPNTVTYDGKVYTHLTGHDKFFPANSDYPACAFDITSCIYGRNIQTKSMDDGKKKVGIWLTSPVCGRANWKKSFNFCDKNDLVAVHYKDIDNPKKKELIYAGKTTCSDSCDNACLLTYGMSVDKTLMNNGSINPGIDGFVGNKECLLKADSSKLKV